MGFFEQDAKIKEPQARVSSRLIIRWVDGVWLSIQDSDACFIMILSIAKPILKNV